MDPVVESVRRGAVHLDGKVADWASRVAVRELDPSQVEGSVLTLITGSTDWDETISLQAAKRYGFLFLDPAEAARATDAWRGEIIRRLAAPMQRTA